MMPPTVSTLDDNASVVSVPASSSSTTLEHRRRSDRDQFSTALDATSGPLTLKGRRSSTVFEHVNGMLDRFGRRLHSRSEVRENGTGSAGSSRRVNSTMISLAGLGTAASDSSEAVSLEEYVSFVDCQSADRKGLHPGGQRVAPTQYSYSYEERSVVTCVSERCIHAAKAVLPFGYAALSFYLQPTVCGCTGYGACWTCLLPSRLLVITLSSIPNPFRFLPHALLTSHSSCYNLQSPNGSNASHTFSPTQVASTFWDRAMSSGSGESKRSPGVRDAEGGSGNSGNMLNSPPNMYRHHSAGSLSVVNDSTSSQFGHTANRSPSAMNPPSSARDPRRISVMERTLIQVTEDNEHFSVVDISGLNSAAAIKERMLSKLHLFDEDPSYFALSRTEIGAMGSTGPRIDDDELLAMCWQMGDEKGSLKFLLHQIAPPATAGSAMILPPPPHNLSPRIMLRDLPEGTSTNTSTTPTSNSRQAHSKPGSLSSRSSVGEHPPPAAATAAAAAEGQSANEGNSDTSSRPSSGLHRTKATNRRSIADEARNLSITSNSDDSSESLRFPVPTSSACPPTNLTVRTGERYWDQHSPIEEISDALDLDDGKYGSQRRSLRPATGPMRHTIHGQWESEMGTSSSRVGSMGPSSAGSMDHVRPTAFRTTSHSSFAESQSPSQAASPSSASSALPRSLLPGGRDPHALDSADAAHMYIGAHEHEHHHPLRPQASQAPLSTIGEDGWRRSRPSVPPAAEMAAHQAEQQRNSDGRYPDPTYRSQSAAPFGPRPSTSDAYVTPKTFNNGQILHASHASPSSSHTGIISPTSPLSRPFDRERSSSFGAGPMANFYGSAPSQSQAMHEPRTMIRPMTPTMFMSRSGVQHGTGHGSHVLAQGQSYMNNTQMRPHGPPNHFPDRRYMGPPQAMPRPPPMHPNEFGVRGVPFDPRLSHSAPRPPQPMQDRNRFVPVNMPPPQQHLAQSREDPYASMHFPASSPRVVTEFQRSSSTRSALQPGMTVQETFQHRNQARPSSSMQFRPAAPHLAQRPVQPVRVDGVARSFPMSQTASLSSSPYGRDGRQAQRTVAPPAQRVEQRRESQPTTVASSGGPIPASMQYYYNPATPTVSPRPVASSIIQPQNLQNSMTARFGTGAERPLSSTSEPAQPVSSERSSGSSFATNSSTMDVRVASSGDGRRLDSEYSAPTSARSSRSMSPKLEEQRASELPYATADHLERSGSLNNDELLNIRPLPRLPGVETSSISSMLEDAPKDEDTFKAGQWKEMLSNLEGEGEGTARARTSHLMPKDPDRPHPFTTASSSASLSTERPQQALQGEAEDGDGTFKTFDDEDEDDDEGGTWARPLDSVSGPSFTDNAGCEGGQRRVKSPAMGEGTLKPDTGLNGTPSISSPRRPVLTLNIEQPMSSSPRLLQSTTSPEPVSESTHAIPSTASPASSNAIGRRTSFARRERGDWAFRPPPEQLYDQLDDFFPKHDLDQPVLDPNTALAPTSPQTSSPRGDVTPMSALSAPAPAVNTISGVGRSRMQHKKSIRIVAQDRKRFLERAAETADRRKAGATDLNRRRSTKLWGGRVIEVTPGTEPLIASTDSPTSATSSEAKPVFKWVKGDLIGKGTYGRVYLALNATTGEMIAVKQVELPTTASDREDARQKGVVSALKSEIETLKDLDHPNIVSYLGFEETQSNLSIFLEYVPGGSVGSCLRKHGKLDEATIKSFLQQILTGLNYLHGRGILHRDLKADNLLVDFNGVVKISDFGTVRKSEDIYGNVASMSMQGSIFWMAPEVVSLSRAGYSAKVDIWSLGCVVLEMFAGRRPWSDEEAVHAMFKIGAERRAPPIPPDVRLSKAAAHFLKTCFAVNPNERPTASRLLDHVFPHAEPGWQFSSSSLYRQLHR